MSLSTRQGCARVVIAGLVAAAVALTPSAASAVIYWGNSNSFGGPRGDVGLELGRASLDGGRADRYWWNVGTTVDDLESHAGKLYWPEAGRIVRADPATGAIDRNFIAGLSGFCEFACDIVVTNTHIFWTEQGDWTDWSRTYIGRANLDGSGVIRAWARPSEYTDVSALATDGSDLFALIGHDLLQYDQDMPGTPGLVAAGIEMDTINGLAADQSYVYFCGHDSVGGFDDVGLIGRVSRAGGAVEPAWVSPVPGDSYFDPWRVAVDGTHVYWSAEYRSAFGGNGSIGRVRLADHHVEPNLVVEDSDLFSPAGLALDPTATAPIPRSHDAKVTGAKVKGKRVQRYVARAGVRARLALVAKAEPVRATVRGKLVVGHRKYALKKVTSRVAAGNKRALTVKVAGNRAKQRRIAMKVATRLRHHQKVVVRIKMVVRDLASNKVRFTRSIRLR